MKTFFETEITYNRIKFYFSDRPAFLEREMHPYHEILFVLSGGAEVFLAGGSKCVQEKTLFIIPEETYHFFKIGDEERFLRLKISIPTDMDEPVFARTLEKLRILEMQGEGVRYALEALCRALREDGQDKGFHAYAAFLMLISALEMEEAEGMPRFTETSQGVQSLMEYIGDHLSGDLTVNRLANRFHTSPSSLTHNFKKECGISLHKFILQKRLLHARKHILNGGRPTKIYALCGFQDYSSFYKAYKNFWGISPSEEK